MFLTSNLKIIRNLKEYIALAWLFPVKLLQLNKINVE